MQAQRSIEFGKYRLVRQIAVGGMAQIWLAIQQGPHGFEKVAVLKVVLPELCSNQDFIQMFLDEARLAASLDHNNVVRIYDFGEIAGRYYLAMEHLPGEDLASIISTCKRTSRDFPIDVACDIIIGAAMGLQFAHDLTDSSGTFLNVVHRDVTPSNIIATYHGTVKLVDFGIARAESNLTRTAAGLVKGKVAYFSPEQASGQPLDRRSDVFALGVVFFELLTRTRLFRRESDLATMQAVVGAEVPRVTTIRSDVPQALEAIVMKALERDATARYQSAAELADDLLRFLSTRGYSRSERAIAQVMSELFDAERRNGKLRISQPVLEPSLATPPQLQNLSSISPIRATGDVLLPSVEAEQRTRTAIPPTPPALSTALGSASPVAAAPATPVAAASVPPVAAAPVGSAAPLPPPEPPASRRGRAMALTITALVALGLLVWSMARPSPQLEVPEARRETTPADSGTTTVVDAGLEPPQQAPVVAPPEPIEVALPVPPTRPTPEKPRPVPKGRLTLDTSPYSEVFWKGRSLGDTPLVDHPMPAGLHILTLLNEGKGIRSDIEVEIVPGQTTILNLKL